MFDISAKLASRSLVCLSTGLESEIHAGGRSEVELQPSIGFLTPLDLLSQQKWSG